MESCASEIRYSRLWEMMRIFSWLWDLIKGEKRFLFLALLLGIVARGLGILYPYMFGLLVDSVVLDKPPFPLPKTVAWILLLSCIYWTIYLLSSYCIAYLDESILYRLRNHVIAHLPTVPYQKIREQNQGELLTRITQDIESISGLFVSHLLLLIENFVVFIGCGILMGLTSFWTTLYLMILLPVTVPVVFWISKKVFMVISQYHYQLGRAMMGVQDLCKNFAMIKVYGGSSKFIKRLEKVFSELRTCAIRYRIHYFILQPIFALIAFLGISIILFTTVGLTWGGYLRPGSLVRYVMLAGISLGSLSSLAGGILELVRISGSLRHLYRLITVVPERIERDLTFPTINRPMKGIRVENLSWKWVGMSQPLFSHVYFHIQAGQLIIFVGPNGHGKSTLLQILSGLLIPVQGNVILEFEGENKNIWECRQQIAYVSQEDLLFQGSIAENIVFPREYLDLSQLTEKEIQILRLLDTNPDKKALERFLLQDTGEFGNKLSSGTLRKILLVRALLSQRPILILDEPEIHLDWETQYLLIDLLRQEHGYRTILISTHFPHLFPFADHIFLVKGETVQVEK